MLKPMKKGDFPKYLQERIYRVWCERKDDFVCDESECKGDYVCFVQLKEGWIDVDGTYTSWPCFTRQQAFDYVKWEANKIED